MLFVLIQWILILYTIVGIGAFVTLSYNKLSKRDELYSSFNLFLIGLCSLVPTLSILRIFIPINFYLYGLFFILVSIFYYFNKSIVIRLLQEVKIFKMRVPTVMLGLLFIFILFFAYNSAVTSFFFDAAYYHLQASKWIETYPLVPGIANIEERLGFNSTFHLLSAPFSLSIFFGEPYFFLHPLFIILFLSWSIYKLYQKVSLLRVLSLLAIVDTLTNYFSCFFDSNTDLLPNIIVLYFIIFLIDKLENKKTLSQQSLLICSVLIVVCTMKVSFSVLAFFTFYIFHLLWKEKSFKAISLLLGFTLITTGFWLYSNVIVSGYLLYPLIDLDLFNVDWKLPYNIGEMERSFIDGSGEWHFYNLLRETKLFFQTFDIGYISSASRFSYNILVFIGFPILLYLKWKKKISISYLILFLLAFTNLLINYKIAADLRFTFGLLYACVLLVLAPWDKNWSPRYTKLVWKLIPLSFAIMTIPLFFNRTLTKIKTNDTIAWIKPLQRETLPDADTYEYSSVFLNNGIELKLSDIPTGITMYNAPCAPNDTLLGPLRWRFNNFKDLESRGTKLTDGFRSRKVD